MPSVPREKYPEMKWRAADKVAAWKLLNAIFVADQIPEERQWALILVAGGDEAYNRWDTLEETVEDKTKVDQVWDAFEKSFEQSTSFWHFRDAYLADFRQDESETMADLDLHIKQTVRGCQWKKESEEERMIDLLYHVTIYYEIQFVQESDPAALTYKMVIEKAKAHECNVLEYKDHQASHREANSAPSYNNPLLSAHALSKRRPSGHGNNNGHRCGKCGKSHERGNCPVYGKTCDRCKGINHFKTVCRSKVTGKATQSPHRSKKSQPPQRHGSMGATVAMVKGGGRRQQRKMPKKPPKQRAYEVTLKNSVLSEVTTTSGGERENHGKVSSKTVLSGPEEEGLYNRFSCFAVHSKMSQSTNAKSKPLEGLYTDTDPDNRSEIIRYHHQDTRQSWYHDDGGLS